MTTDSFSFGTSRFTFLYKVLGTLEIQVPSQMVLCSTPFCRCEGPVVPYLRRSDWIARARVSGESPIPMKGFAADPLTGYHRPFSVVPLTGQTLCPS